MAAAYLELTADVCEVLRDNVAQRGDEGLPSVQDVEATFEALDGTPSRRGNRRVK
jgi:hypothetical protein